MSPKHDHLDACWQAEWLRLREAHWGPLEDAAEVRRARTQGHTFTQRILLRARFLCQREGLDAILHHWIQGARLALLVLGMLAVLAGAGAALGALGNGAAPVNIALALTAMLGLHCLTYLLWLLSFAVHSDAGGARLGQVWLWLTRKLARGPDAALVPRALAGLLGRNGSLRWVLGGISHGLWTLAFASLIIVLLTVLAARRYDFAWQTTLLTPDTFVHLTAVLGWLPSQMGFAIPSETIVRASNGLQAAPDAARGLWSSWLIGCVVVYGLLPRVVGLVLSVFSARRRIARLTIDESQPGYADLRQRLEPASETTGIDAPDAPQDGASPRTLRRNPDGTGKPAIAGIELPADLPWPPAPLDAPMVDLGVIDSRAQRQATLDQLQQHAPSRLLVVCDARQTPDRGAIALITALSALAGDMRISLVRPIGDDTRARLTTWRERLVAAGFATTQIHDRIAPAMAWLINPPEPKHD